jgi:hypothetical protein
MRNFFLCFSAAALLVACGPSEQEKERLAQENRIKCADNLCPGDKPPTGTSGTEILKLDGRWFVGPKEYFSMGSNGSVFYWPSRTPGFRGGSYPEKGQDFYDIAVEIFLRSNHNQASGPTRFKRLQLAHAEGRVLEKHQVRPGLEVWRVQDEIKSLNQKLWYVATDLKDANSEPPILICDDQNPNIDNCTMAFMWRPGIAADLRLRAKHGQDWPEIYQEVTRVLALIKEA